MRRQSLNSPAIVLRHVKYGESDLIVSFLTPEHGLLRGYARGARKSIKRFGPALEPFSQIEMHWQQGRGDLVTLLDAELLAPHQGLRESLQTLALASYAVEVFEMLLHEGEAQTELYQLLGGYLDHLAHQGSPDIARLLFELRLVQHLGYIPHLLHCSECYVPFEGGMIAFDPLRGGSLCSLCAGDHSSLQVHHGTLGSLSRSLKTPLGLFEGFHFGATTLQEGSAMLSLVMSAVLPRPPKSLRFVSSSAGSTSLDIPHSGG